MQRYLADLSIWFECEKNFLWFLFMYSLKYTFMTIFSCYKLDPSWGLQKKHHLRSKQKNASKRIAILYMYILFCICQKAYCITWIICALYSYLSLEGRNAFKNVMCKIAAISCIGLIVEKGFLCCGILQRVSQEIIIHIHIDSNDR